MNVIRAKSAPYSCSDSVSWSAEKKTKTHYKSTKTGQPDWKDSDWEPAWKNVGHQPLMRNNMTK